MRSRILPLLAPDMQRVIEAELVPCHPSAGPCSGNTPHTHPRGSEISFITEGEVGF